MAGRTGRLKAISAERGPVQAMPVGNPRHLH
jgi:hypothetical protein